MMMPSWCIIVNTAVLMAKYKGQHDNPEVLKEIEKMTEVIKRLGPMMHLNDKGMYCNLSPVELEERAKRVP